MYLGLAIIASCKQVIIASYYDFFPDLAVDNRAAVEEYVYTYLLAYFRKRERERERVTLSTGVS